MAEPISKNIHTAINAVMAEVGYVQKEKKQGLNYSFASEKALIEALRPEMVKNGIYMYVSHLDAPVTHSYETKGGSLMNHTLLSGRVSFVHAPSQTSVASAAIGEGADTGDKSANKAMTAMYKYALRQTFCIETGDDPDNTPSDTQTRGSREPNVSTGYKAPPKATQPEWMKQANLAAKAAGKTVSGVLGMEGSPTGAEVIAALGKWQSGNGYTDEEAVEEFKKLVAE